MGVLEKIDKPSDMRIIKKKLLLDLAKEIRERIINTVSSTGGHLASSLGTVELTLALHYVFDAPVDKVVWDVGHQAYTHKLITGRRDQFSTLRQYGGISGFPRREESPFDTFGVGHSSTAISAGLGMAIARDIKGENNKVIAVIGDGSFTGGEAFEGLNNAGHIGKDMIVILNDNEMFISRKIGAIAGYLTKITTAGLYKNLVKRAERFLTRASTMGVKLSTIAKRVKVLLFPGMIFEEMGFAYLGPFDGHDLFKLIDMFTTIKDMKGPVFLHIITKKGKGYKPAEKGATLFHGIGKFNVITGEPEGTKKHPTYTQVFGRTMMKMAEEDERIVAITAAMATGTGLDEFGQAFPKRFFDVGIAEQHAVTFAGGLAVEGLKPVVAIYSTFMQRALDQVIHDICLQKLHVVFALDRGGLVGEDGATHQGVFDLSFLRMIPNMVVMAPKDEDELQHMLKTAIDYDGPIALRYPRGFGEGVKMEKELKILEIGKAEVLEEGNDVAVIAVGKSVSACWAAVKDARKQGINATLVNARFIKPLDEELIRTVALRCGRVLTVEENVLSGGFGSAVREMLADTDIKVHCVGIPDKFIEHGSCDILRAKYGLSKDKIQERILQIMQNERRQEGELSGLY
ncbi:MAG: 1-deoxy-D-xylulose-5-phosphate synthase [bacterium]